MKLSRIGIGLLIASLGTLAFATSPSAGSSSPNQLPTWWQKGQWLLNNQAPLTCSQAGQDSSHLTNIDISNELTPQSETTIAINPTSASTIVAGSNEIFCLPMAAYVSTGSGAKGTWVHSAPPLPPPLTTNGQDFGSDPGVAWDTKGDVFYSYIVVFFNRTFHAVQGSEMAVARSKDGLNWNATFFNPNVGNGKFNDKPMIAVDTNPGPHQNTIYVAWDNASPKNGKSSDNDVILVSHSTDGGVTFSDPVQASPSQGGPAAVIGADPFIGPDHTLYVAWQDGVNPSIQVAASHDGGQTFGNPVQIASTLAVFQVLPPAQASRGALIYPACGAAPTGSRLYCSWSDATASDGMRVFVSRSDDGGLTWPTKVRVSDVGVVSDQFNQWLAVDPVTGKVYVSWNDSRNDPSRLSTDVFFAKSSDGVTFSTSPVTNASTNETTAGADLGNQYGDYEGISAFNNIVQPVWTDRRTLVPPVPNLDEEVYTATISII